VTTEVVQHQVGTADAELVEHPGQVPGVAVDGVDEGVGLVRATEAGHVRCDGAGERAGAGDQAAPVLGRAGVAVHEHDGLVGGRGPRGQVLGDCGRRPR
jgi:hypothetical protein